MQPYGVSAEWCRRRNNRELWKGTNELNRSSIPKFQRQPSRARQEAKSFIRKELNYDQDHETATPSVA
jgi:hypothetical protein